MVYYASMKNFSVTYRGKDGKQQVLQIAVEDRKGVFDELAKRGISAIRIEETNGKVKPRKPADGKKNPAVAKGLVAGVIVVAVAVGAFLFLTKDKATAPEDAKPKKPAKIHEVTPVKITPKPVEEKVVTPEKPKPLRKWEYPVERTNELSAAELRKWKVMHRPPPGYTNDTARTEAPPEYAIFDHHSENEIACLLTLTPGTTLVGTPIYGKRFTEDFLKSCETPIVITEDDTPEQADLKRLMIDTKIDLRQRMSEGEDLGKILLDTREEFQRLASYKQMLQQELNEIKKDDSLSTEEIDDFVKAANKMLEEKGIAPIKLSPISRRAMMRRRGL